jgi:hypothetical protein
VNLATVREGLVCGTAASHELGFADTAASASRPASISTPRQEGQEAAENDAAPLNPRPAPCHARPPAAQAGRCKIRRHQPPGQPREPASSHAQGRRCARSVSRSPLMIQAVPGGVKNAPGTIAALATRLGLHHAYFESRATAFIK